MSRIENRSHGRQQVRSTRKTRPEARKARRSFLPTCEILENRYVPTTPGTLFTTLANVNQTVVGGAPDLPNIKQIDGTSLGGMAYDNDISHTTPQVNDLINVVVVDQVTSYNASNGTNPLAGFSPNTLTMVAAAQGQITAISNGIFTVNFLSGELAFFIASGNTYNPQEPSTWGATDSTGTHFQGDKALYTMTLAQNVFPGNGQGIAPFGADEINQTSLNTNASQQT
jgi:hypothetical protein